MQNSKVRKYIKNEIPKLINKNLIIKLNKKKSLLKIEPQKNVKDYHDLGEYKHIISSYKTKMLDYEDRDSLQNIISSLNKTKIYSKNNETKKEFSFHSILKNKKILFNKKNLELSHIASTLNAAIILAGLTENIKKANNKQIVDYIEAGLDLKVDIDNDYKFINPSKKEYLILSQIKNNEIWIYILAKDPKTFTSKLEIVKKNITNSQTLYIEKNVQEMADFKNRPGKDGLTAVVNLIIKKNGIIKKNKIFTIKYSPLEKITYIPAESTKK